jgi:hypothetical protein
MPANSTQRLACHVASGAGAAQLNASDVIFKTKQLQAAAVAFHPRSNAFKDASNDMQFLLVGLHIFPFTIYKDD